MSFPPERSGDPVPLDIVVLHAQTEGVHRGSGADQLPDVGADLLDPIRATLESLGHRVALRGVRYENLESLQNLEAGFVLNLVDGTGSDGHPGVEVPIMLEDRGIPFSGAGSSFYHLTSDKWAMKIALAAAGVPVPRGALVPHPDAPLPRGLRYPLIVKPRDGYGSLGIEESSIVGGPGELRAIASLLLARHDTDVLVEEFVEGREITVAMLGSSPTVRALPPLEFHFEAGRPAIRTFSSKFGQEAQRTSRATCPADLAPRPLETILRIAHLAHRAVNGDGYGRVDIRLASDGTPYVLEVNANCSLELAERPEDCGTFLRVAHGAGLSHRGLLQALILEGLRRPAPRRRPSSTLCWIDGSLRTRALRDLPAGECIGSYEAVCRVRSMAYRGQRVRFLRPSAEPSVEVCGPASDASLRTRRSVQAGEELTLSPGAVEADRFAPTRPRVVGVRGPATSTDRLAPAAGRAAAGARARAGSRAATR